jgi:hypothetical protein
MFRCTLNRLAVAMADYNNVSERELLSQKGSNENASPALSMLASNTRSDNQGDKNETEWDVAFLACCHFAFLP